MKKTERGFYNFKVGRITISKPRTKATVILRKQKAHKVSRFCVRHNNRFNMINKNELRAIALDFKAIFKASGDMKDYYQYLMYSNRYGDFNRVIYS